MRRDDGRGGVIEGEFFAEGGEEDPEGDLTDHTSDSGGGGPSDNEGDGGEREVFSENPATRALYKRLEREVFPHSSEDYRHFSQEELAEELRYLDQASQEIDEMDAELARSRIEEDEVD